jgi:GNAT superfamily N-acetyltransferase
MVALILARDYRQVAGRFRRWLYSESLSFGLRRDLIQPFQAREAKIPITVRPMQPGDALELLDANAAGLNGQGIYERLTRWEFVQAEIPTGYVAVTTDGRPCYMQFLILPEENPRIQAYFKGLFPWLAPDEALLEHAVTPERSQGLGIMPHAMSRIAERAAASGARWVITFVAQSNAAALKGCQRAGFSPYILRRERWRFFRRQVSFEPLPATSTPAEQDRSPATARSTGP